MSADHTILVCGSRGWTDRIAIEEQLAPYRNADGKIIRVITGGARGADQIAHSTAASFGFDTLVMPADWNRLGRQAGYARNLRMLDEDPDLVIAFSLGTAGTQHTINEASRRLIPVRVIGRAAQEDQDA